MIMTDFNTAVKDLMNNIVTDYRDWQGRTEYGPMQEMIDHFEETLTTNAGRKYLKIVADRSVWGFVVKEDGPKFKKGDILLAASFNSPALNKARGNIFEGYEVKWTGPYYL